MSKRLWLLGVVGLVLVGLLVACGSNYNRSQDGLLLVGSQGSSVIETFSFTLSNGHVSAIANSPNDTANQTCVLNGSPSSMVMDPKGAYAYVIFNKSSQCSNATQYGIATFQVGSDGSVKQVGSLTTDPNPVSLAMDTSGKFLFVAEGNNSTASSPNSAPCPGTTAQYGVCVYAIGSGGALTGVQGNFTFVNGTGFQNPNIVAVAPSPTVFPGIGINGTNASVCSVPGNPAPTSEFLYAVDSTNYVVWEFAVDTSTGALGNPANTSMVPSFATDKVPAGVAVDPCDRFVYVSDSLTNKVSGYKIGFCAAVSPPCGFADGGLSAVAGSPFALSGNANGPGPIVVDPYGNNVYVVGTLSNTISPFKISPQSGALTALNPATIATGLQPTAITIRGDDNWMFVSNYNAATVSQYSITPATGALNAEAPIQTDNYPWGVAVK
jgi:6-phosphogluconolactonase (cycloisomerase 2 family)